jgi:hypothetical protein
MLGNIFFKKKKNPKTMLYTLLKYSIKKKSTNASNRLACFHKNFEKDER